MVTGSTGLLGPYLMEAFQALGRVAGLARKNADIRVDCTDGKAVAEALGEFGPDIVVHAAAMTDVDACERDPDAAFALNRDAVANVRDALGPDAGLVLISTDQVYPDRAGPHREGDEDPVNVYGQSKLAGELAALSHPGALVLRTNIFGPSRTPGRASLSDFFIKALPSGQPVKMFRDIFFSPLHMATLGQVLVLALERGIYGVFNAGCREGASKRDFGLAVAAHKGLPLDRAEACDSTDLPGRARRPKDMRMDVTRLEKALGMNMPTLSREVEKL